ncbi:MAG TPA: alpha-galactosidase, partial [Verrucomicrobiae bacterium]|nr:alpha-galactosidase [Verrucomicrobiae bacterium]
MDHRLSRWLRVVVAIASGISFSASAAESPPVYPTNALAPSIQGPGVYGIRPHTAFLYALPARGKPPMRFEVVGLPTGLSIDDHTGIVSGSLQQEGTYEVVFRVSNEHGTAEKQFRIVAGEQLCLTPPMGWNSWNAVGEKVNETIVREAADALVTSGLKDAGYQYVVIDDHWEGGRDAEGHLVPNPKKFPSGIKALADYVHSKGLKLGIYSDAGEKTCGGEVGSFGFEELDAQTFAAWGLDYLKYDYCNAPDDFQEAIRRYTRMGQALRAAN